jgi:hypothetical protein
MTGGLNIYQVNQGRVIGPYQAAYLWVDIQGYDSEPGQAARWMLAGAYGPDPKTAAALCRYYNMPIRVGGSRFEPITQGSRAIGSLGGRDIITVEFKPAAGEGAPAVFLLHYLSRSTSGELIVNQIPGVARMREAEVLSVSIHAPTDDLFASFPIKSIDWAAEVLDGAYSFSFPRPAAAVALSG